VIEREMIKENELVVESNVIRRVLVFLNPSEYEI
jgi:hypothetical protein